LGYFWAIQPLAFAAAIRLISLSTGCWCLLGVAFLYELNGVGSAGRFHDSLNHGAFGDSNSFSANGTSNACSCSDFNHISSDNITLNMT
jgi:hypothetical protein